MSTSASQIVLRNIIPRITPVVKRNDVAEIGKYERSSYSLIVLWEAGFRDIHDGYWV